MKSAIALPLQQHPKHATALRLLGCAVSTIAVPHAAPVIAVKRLGQLITSRGPIWRLGTSGAQKSKALKQSGIRLTNAETADHDPLKSAGYRCLMTPAHVAEIDLTGTPAMRIAQMKPKWRSAWRISQALHITEQQFDPQNHAWILQADLSQQRAKGFRGLPHALVSAYAACDPKSVRVYITHDGGTPTSAMIFVLHAPVVTYHIGVTSPQGRSLCAHHQMITQAADMFAQRGFERLDLGTVDTINARGLARFKIGCGAHVRALGGTWIRLPGR